MFSLRFFFQFFLKSLFGRSVLNSAKHTVSDWLRNSTANFDAGNYCLVSVSVSETIEASDGGRPSNNSLSTSQDSERDVVERGNHQVGTTDVPTVSPGNSLLSTKVHLLLFKLVVPSSCCIVFFIFSCSLFICFI